MRRHTKLITGLLLVIAIGLWSRPSVRAMGGRVLADVFDAGSVTTGTLASARGGTGVSNAGTLTNATATTITDGGTLALGGFTATVPWTGTVVTGGAAVVANDITTNNDATNWIRITGLGFTPESGATYIVRATLRCDTNGTADVKFYPNGPSTSASQFMVLGGENGSLLGSAVGVFNEAAQMTQCGTNNVFEVTCSFTATNTTAFFIDFAQNTATVVDTTIKAGSCMTWQRVQ